VADPVAARLASAPSSVPVVPLLQSPFEPAPSSEEAERLANRTFMQRLFGRKPT
jgi:hypothetical protein